MILTAWIRNELCDFTQGLSYQLLIALPGVLLSACIWGWITRASKHRFIHIITYIIAVLIDIGFTLFALYNWPSLVSFGQFYGYFAGSIYDESLDVIQTLITWRIGTAALCLCFFLAQTPHAGRAKQFLLPILGILLAGGYHYWLSETEQITPLGRSAIQQSLWQTVGNDKFRVHYVPSSKVRLSQNKEKYRIYQAYSRDYNELKEFFNAEPMEPIDIWVYPNRETKGHFIGAKNTSFARIWKNEVHLVKASPDSTLARHEMAHLFAGSFGLEPLRVAGGFHIPALGWIEGLAMAAEWPVQTYDLHTWSAAIFARQDIYSEIKPHELLYGFWGLPPRVAYTLAGSWVHWLIEQYGIETVKKLSQGMPGDFEETIETSFIDTFEAWKSDLRTHYFNEKAAKLVPMTFGATSIWTKHCARANAAALSAWYQCLNDEFCAVEKTAPIITTCTENCEHTTTQTLQDLEKIYYFYMVRGPIEHPKIRLAESLYKTSHPMLQKLASQVNAPQTPDGGFADASAAQLRQTMLALYSQLDESGLPDTTRLIWQERRADMMFHAGYDRIAAIMYDALRHQTLPEPMIRRLEIKSQAANAPGHAVSNAIKLWFFTDTNKTYIAEQNDHDQVIAYLDFVDAMNERDFDRAHRAFARLFMSIPTHDEKFKLSPLAWKNVFHWLPFL